MIIKFFCIFIIINLIIPVIGIRYLKKTHRKFLFLICLIVSILVYVLSFISEFSNNFLFLVTFLYLLITLSLLIGWVYFTFAEGFSSEIIVRIKKDSEFKNSYLKNYIIKNSILNERMEYLIGLGYLSNLKQKFSLSVKGKIIATIHKIICKFLNLGIGGGLK